MKEVDLLAHGVGKSQEVQLILGMFQTKCLNKLIGFDLLVSLFSLISILSRLVVEILKSEAHICSFLILMFPENKGNCSVSPCWYYSLQKELYWPFLFGLNFAFAFCPHSYAEQVWKKPQFVLILRKTCTEETLLKMIFGKCSALYFNHSDKNGYMLIPAILSVLPDLTSSYWQICALGNFVSVSTHKFLLCQFPWVSATKTIIFIKN